MSTEMQKEVTRNALHSELGSSAEERVARFHHMQETQPIRYRPEYNLWEVFRYKDVQQVLSDHATFSIDKCLPEGLPFALGKSDPPEHRRLRSLVSQAFSPRCIEGLVPRIVQIVDELLQVAIANGKMNVDTELAHPLPMRIIAEILGLPLEDQERFRQWSAQLVNQLSGMRHTDNSEILHYFSDLLNERKRAPRDDLMSVLVAAEENGPHMTHETIISLCVELMLAGHIATSRLLTSVIQRSCGHPEIYQALHDDPSLIPGVIEETLRYDLPLDQWRTARHDTILAGHLIKAGQYVVTWTGAANFDETHFPHAEQFDIGRSPNPHLAFGYGVHACPGHALARLETRITLERIVAHFSEIHLDTEHPMRVMDLIWPKPMRFLNVLLTARDAHNS